MNTQAKKGFTLIELLVSVALFTIVMVTSLGALLSMSAASRRAQAYKTAIDNLSSAVESMARTIRTGSDYGCAPPTGGNCPSGATSITFKAFSGQDTYYRLDTTSAVCGQTGTIGCVSRSTNGIDWLAITAPEIVVENIASFYVFGAPIGSLDNVQPRVVITLRGYVQLSGTQQVPFNIQTNVTQRIYDQ